LSVWNWEAAARSVGVDRDGRFNAGAITLTNPSALIWRRANAVVSLSGQDLGSLARRTASVLKTAGVRPGDRVAGLLGRRPEAYAVPLAVWQLGAVYVPLFSGFGPEALQSRLEDSGATFAVTDRANRDNLAEAEVRLEALRVLLVGGRARDGDLSYEQLLEHASESAGIAPTRRTDPATIMYTSGTSGPPKGCVIPHHGVFTLWPFVERCLGLLPHDVLFSTADTGWSFGLYTTGLSPLSLGSSRLLFEGPFDAAEWWDAVRKLSVTHLASAPTGFRQLAAAGVEPLRDGVGSLQKATSAGEPLNPEVIRWFEEHAGLVIYDSYGLTELGMVIANLREPGSPRLPLGSMGYPIPGFDVQLIDDAGGVVEEDGEGKIAIRDNGYLLSVGYWGRDAEWNAHLQDGWWVTEDIARREADDRYWYVGRADDVIVTAAYNVGPFEVESALLEHPLVIEAACVGEPDQRKGQVVVVHVVLAGEPSDDPTAEFKRWVGSRIGWHAAPRRVYVRDQLPRTESGKIQRRKLREESMSL
jgi:acetyl-CoA synthetase